MKTVKQITDQKLQSPKKKPTKPSDTIIASTKRNINHTNALQRSKAASKQIKLTT